MTKILQSATTLAPRSPRLSSVSLDDMKRGLSSPMWPILVLVIALVIGWLIYHFAPNVPYSPR